MIAPFFKSARESLNIKYTLKLNKNEKIQISLYNICNGCFASNDGFFGHKIFYQDRKTSTFKNLPEYFTPFANRFTFMQVKAHFNV